MSTTPYLTFLFGILTEDQICSAHFAPASSPAGSFQNLESLPSVLCTKRIFNTFSG